MASQSSVFHDGIVRLRPRMNPTCHVFLHRLHLFFQHFSHETCPGRPLSPRISEPRFCPMRQILPPFLALIFLEICQDKKKVVEIALFGHQRKLLGASLVYCFSPSFLVLGVCFLCSLKISQMPIPGLHKNARNDAKKTGQETMPRALPFPRPFTRTFFFLFWPLHAGDAWCRA